MRKAILLLLLLASMFLTVGWASDKDEFAGTYQLQGSHDDYFITVEKTSEKNEYIAKEFFVREDLDKAYLLGQRIVKTELQEKTLHVVDGSQNISVYYHEQKLWMFGNDIELKKISNKKLSAKKMKKYVNHYIE